MRFMTKFGLTWQMFLWCSYDVLMMLSWCSLPRGCVVWLFADLCVCVCVFMCVCVCRGGTSQMPTTCSPTLWHGASSLAGRSSSPPWWTQSALCSGRWALTLWPVICSLRWLDVTPASGVASVPGRDGQKHILTEHPAVFSSWVVLIRDRCFQF